MSRLQTCSHCGAQFDVSSFAPGQQFTCGSCGTVLTAHAPSGTPNAPSQPAVTGRTPGSRRPGGAAPANPAGAPRRGMSSQQPPSSGAGAGGRRRRGPAEGPARTSGARGTGGGPARGPQYRPPDRRQDPRGAAAAAQPSRRTRGGREPAGRERAGRAHESEGYERPARGGFNPAMIYGGGAVLVAVVLIILLVGGGDDKGGTNDGAGSFAAAGPSTSEPEASKDTVASLRAELSETNLRRPDAYRSYVRRFLALGGEEAKEQVRLLYADMVEKVAPDDAAARKFLGHTDFQADILGHPLAPNEDPVSESIFNRRGYPELDAVVEFNRIRWLDDEEEIELAKQAVAWMRGHAKKLETDHQYRAADQIRANIATNKLLSAYNYETRWAAPYLICFSSKKRLSEFDLMQVKDRKKRREMRKELKEERKEWSRVIDEKERIYTQLYKEWMRRYGERFGLKDLYDEYGGRPDLKTARSFADGVPLVIWIFTDREAFMDYHANVKGENIAPWAAGYFSPQTSWIYLYDEEDSNSDRIFEINKNLHEGTHQLEHWFTRQRNRWRIPHFSQSAFSEGIAEYLGSVEMDKERKIRWTGVNQTRLRNMQGFARQLKKRNQEYYLIPVERLTWISRYSDIVRWGTEKWGLDQNMMMALFYQQAWALTYFLNEFENGKYREKFMEYFDAVLSRETGLNEGQQVFKRIFRIRDEEDWEEIEEEWKKFVFEKLMNMKVPEYQPPKRDDWD